MSAGKMDLSERRIVVTGASRGIGKSIAAELGRCGASLGLIARDAAALDEVSRGLGEQHDVRVVWRVADVTDAAAVAGALQEIERELEGVDGLVNNAGSNGGSKPFASYEDGEFERLLDLNLGSVARITRLVLPALERHGGSIVNVASTSGKMGVPMWSGYCAAKHGVLGFTKSLARELALKDVRVNAVCPGFVQTDMLSDERLTEWANHLGMSRRELVNRVILMQTPQARFVDPTSVARMVAFLLSEHAADITGQAINVSCGIGDY